MNSAKNNLTGFWAWLAKLVIPQLSESNLLDAAEWAVELWLNSSIEKPERRQVVINLAHDWVTKVDAFIDRIDAETTTDVLR